MIDNNVYNKILKYAVIMMASFIIILGIIVVSITSSVYKQTELEKIRNIGELFISCISEEYNNTGSFNSDESIKLHDLFTNEYNVIICIYNQDSECVLSGCKNEDIPTPVQENIKLRLDKGQYLDLNSREISSEEPYLLYGNKFVVKYNDVHEKMYALVYGRTDNISMFTMKIFLAYSIISIIIFIILFIIIKEKVRKRSKHTNDAIRILKQYSQGDFSEKIPTDDSVFPSETAKYINALALDVETSEETSKTFIANVSHELRTPITTIGGFVDGILDGTIPKSQRNEYLVIVSNEIQRLKILISSMLNMSRFESGTLKPNFKDTNLTDLVIKTAFMFEKKIESKNVEVEEFDADDLIAEVDPDLIQQVIYNLIENAVKFVNNGGKLSFSFEKKDNMCIVGIKNTGMGLKDSEIPQVFDRFYKTDSSRGMDTNGLGLGLSISRRILHINNGNIAVKSVYGEYTEFLIQVPQKQNLS